MFLGISHVDIFHTRVNKDGSCFFIFFQVTSVQIKENNVKCRFHTSLMKNRDYLTSSKLFTY